MDYSTLLDYAGMDDLQSVKATKQILRNYNNHIAVDLINCKLS